MTAGLDPDDRIDLLEDALDHIREAAELIRRLGDPLLDAYVLPQLEGQEGGWLGTQAVDHLRAALATAEEERQETSA